jgi:hypothetical protein
MPNPNTNFRKPSQFAKPALAAFLFATSFYMLHGVAAETCHLFHNFAWVAFEILRPALLAFCDSLSAHLSNGFSLPHRLVQVLAANSSVASWIVGQ